MGIIFSQLYLCKSFTDFKTFILKYDYKNKKKYKHSKEDILLGTHELSRFILFYNYYFSFRETLLSMTLPLNYLFFWWGVTFFSRERFLFLGWLYPPLKIVLNLPGTYEKLPCEGKPDRFSG